MLTYDEPLHLYPSCVGLTDGRLVIIEGERPSIAAAMDAAVAEGERLKREGWPVEYAAVVLVPSLCPWIR